MLRGRAIAESPETGEAGVAEISVGVRLWDDSHAMVTRPFNLTLLGEAHQLNGRTAKALELVTQADKLVRKFGERYYEAEIKRLMGKLLLRASPEPGHSNQQIAEKWLLEAVHVAKSHRLKSSELRATTDLALLHFLRGKKSIAIAELEAALSWFTEGFNTGDLVAARELLQKMSDESQSAVVSDYFTPPKTG